MTLLTDLLILGLATSTISVTVGQSKLFRPVRQLVNMRMGRFFGDLIECPYCLGHWVAVPVVAMRPLLWIGESSPSLSAGKFVLLWLATVGISSLVSGIVNKLYD